MNQLYKGFIKSKMFLGTKAYPTIKNKRWDGIMYLSKFNGSKYKIGYTYHLRDRIKSLMKGTKKQDPSRIVWIWASPAASLFEYHVKDILQMFIDRKGSKEGKTEIIHGIPFEPLVLTIRLIILHVMLKYSYLRENKPGIQNILSAYFEGDYITTVKYNNQYNHVKETGQEYTFKTNSTNKKYKVEEIRARNGNKYVIKWKGVDKTTEEPRDMLLEDIPDMIRDFDMKNVKNVFDIKTVYKNVQLPIVPDLQS
jgi:hypothetical protein